ncbi:MAG: dihydrofolate reductase family protein [Saprospiraceae bacterium]|nr:dihydrofolate reductase family protein [Saprospiraceae bacterium]MCF8250897.1 dihydrofolate reductase family protein [Saprospiraceae bacterium]MCF8282716.1 dihydrofolate reductase family protein [Bacteroidales bacterium]MCF8311862.1 dihydrofolate reductase family protein [Saprospiraceae bacterium]MCF8443024.1 dihydrofolate reductase family protein [Saprospiraceae bacterium]
MGKTIFYVAASLDGFLADENGSVDWLMPFQNEPYDYGYTDFLGQIGHVLTGSLTYEQAKEFPGGWNFPDTTTWVFAQRNLETEGRNDIILWRNGAVELMEKLRSEPKDIWLLGGARLAANFFNEGLVDELVLTQIPLVLGKGKPLFEGVAKQFDLRLQKVEQFPNGVVQLTYAL